MRAPTNVGVHTPTNVGVRTLTNVGVRTLYSYTAVSVRTPTFVIVRPEFDWTHCGRIRIGLSHHCGKYCLPFKG